MSSMRLPVTCGLILIGVGLYFAPDGVAARLHSVIADGFRPGNEAVRMACDSFREGLSAVYSKSAQAQQRELEQLRSELIASRAQNSVLVARLAQANDQDLVDSTLPMSLRRLPRLMIPALIDAAVLCEPLAEAWRSGRLLDRGEASGIRASSLVVNSRQPLVDVGQDGSLSAEDALLLGRCVIGKIERVGRWTSTFLLLTDAAYRGRAQLIQETDSGFAFGPRGILKGQGSSLCRLEGIASTESVRVGDAVYSADRDGLVSAPLYYGKVVEATLEPDDREWQVRVEPAPLPSQLTRVQILRTTVNSERLTAGF